MKYLIAAAVAAALSFFTIPSTTTVRAEVDPPCGEGHLTNNLPTWAIQQGIETCNEFDTLQALADECRERLADTYGAQYRYRFYTAAGEPTADTSVFFANIEGESIFCFGADQVHGLACATWNNDPEQRSPTFTAEECEQFRLNAFHRGILIDARGNQGRVSNPADTECFGKIPGFECEHTVTVNGEEVLVKDIGLPSAGSGGLLDTGSTGYTILAALGLLTLGFGLLTAAQTVRERN